MAIEAASLLVRVGADTADAERELSRFGKGLAGLLSGFTGQAEKSNSALQQLFTFAGGAVLASTIQNITGQLVDLGQEALDTYAFFERLRLSMEAMSARELVDAGFFTNVADAAEIASLRAEELVGWIEEIAVYSPFLVKDVAQTIRMGMGLGFTSDQAQRLTQDFADFSAATGQSGDVITRMAKAFGEVRSIGHVMTRQLNMMAIAGIDARKILTKTFGITLDELEEFVRKGLIPADIAIEAILQNLEKNYAGVAREQTYTFAGLLASLHDIRALRLRDLFAGVFESVQPFLGLLVDTLMNPQIIARIKAIGDTIGQYVGAALWWVSGAVARFYGAFVAAGGGIQGIIKGIGQAFQVNDITASIIAIVAAFGPLMIVIGSLGALVSLVFGGIAALIGALTSPVGLVAAAVMALYVAWQTNFGGIQEKTAEVWANIYPILQQFMAWLAFALPIAVATLATWFDGAWKTVGQALTDAWAVAGPVLQELWAWMQVNIPVAAAIAWAAMVVAWNFIVGAVGGAWNTILPYLQQFWTWLTTDLPQAAQDFWPQIQSAWGQVSTAITDAWNTILPYLQQFWTWLTVTLPVSAGAFWLVLTAAWSSIVGTISSTWSQILPYLQQFWTWMTTDLPQAAQGLWPQIQSTWSQISATIGQVWSQILPYLQQFWTWMTTTLPIGALAAWGALTMAWGFISAAITNAWAVIVPSLQEFWRWMNEDLPTVASEMQASISGAWNAVSSKISDVWGVIQPTFQELWNWLTINLPAAGAWLFASYSMIFGSLALVIGGAINTLTGALGGDLQTKLDTLSSFFGSEWPQNLATFKTAWDGMVNSIKAGAQWAGGVLQPAFQRLQDSFSGLGEKFANLSGPFSRLGEALGRLKPAFDAVSASLAWLGVVIGGTIVVALNFVINMMAAMLERIDQIVGPIIDAIASTINMLVDVAGEAAIGWRAIMEGDFGGAMRSLGNIVTRYALHIEVVWNRLQESASAVWGAIRDAIVKSLNDVGLNGNKIMTDFEKEMSNLWLDMVEPVNKVRDALNQAWEKLKAFWNYLTTTTSPSNPFSAIEGFIASLEAKFGELTTAAKTAWSAITNAPNAALNAWESSVGKYIPDVGVWPTPRTAPYSYGPPKGARGFTDFPGGPAIVGEKGPELVWLPKHANVLTNPETLALLRQGIPGFAEGTGSAPPLPGGYSVYPVIKPTSSYPIQTKPIDVASAVAEWRKGAGVVVDDWGKAAEKAAGKVAQALEGALRKVPGLFGTSSVTEDQMKMAALGVPQNFADDYLRRLTDEVVNGVEWADVDIKEAAAAAGIDPNLPAKAILEMFRQSWESSALFANPENLKFINQDAVKRAIEEQQKSVLGEQNILQLFGIEPDKAGIDLVTALSSGIAAAVTPDMLAEAGGKLAGGVASSSSAALPDALAESGMGETYINGITNSVKSPEGKKAVDDLAAYISEQVTNAMGAIQVPFPGLAPETGGGAATGGTSKGGTSASPKKAALPVRAFASGTNFYPGGIGIAGEYGPELILPRRGSRILNADTTAEILELLQASGAGGGVTIQQVIVNNGMDVEALGYRLNQLQRRRGR